MDQIGDILGYDTHIQALPVDHPIIVFLELVPEDALLRLGHDRPWRDGIHAYAMGSELARQRFGEAEHRAFGRDIGDIAAQLAVESDRSEVDDLAPAPVLHVR